MLISYYFCGYESVAHFWPTVYSGCVLRINNPIVVSYV